MEDLSGKISELLSDPESMQQISELAAMLQGNAAEQPPAPVSTPAPAEPPLFDPAMLMRLGELMQSSSQPDQNAALLLALKPHLGQRRQVRVDKAVKLLRLYGLWKAAQRSGMLQDLI